MHVLVYFAYYAYSSNFENLSPCTGFEVSDEEEIDSFQRENDAPHPDSELGNERSRQLNLTLIEVDHILFYLFSRRRSGHILQAEAPPKDLSCHGQNMQDMKYANLFANYAAY